MKTFKREFRYIVAKLADANAALNDDEKRELHRLYSKIADWRKQQGKRHFVVVVVEDDWPEYEPIWKSLERRFYAEQKKTEKDQSEK